LLLQLTRALLVNLLHQIGYSFVKELVILPFATGMSLALTFLTLKTVRPEAKYIIWPRIDQKTCFKSMFTANMIPIVIEPIIDNNGEIQTNIKAIEEAIANNSNEEILCVFSTTSCFAPRGYDDIKSIAILCKEKEVPHIVNNAYGIYCTKIRDDILQSLSKGRIDCLVSSTDKNFMVPVGGSIIYSSNNIKTCKFNLIEKIQQNYPGRASASPIIDMFITLLEMGKNKYLDLIKERKEMFKILKQKMTVIAEFYGEKIIETKNNKISISMTLCNTICKSLSTKKEITYLGSLFFNRQISGIKIIARSSYMDFNGYKFANYGGHSNDYQYLPYVVFAAAIGIKLEDVTYKLIKD